jgi:hypothetical protein
MNRGPGSALRLAAACLCFAVADIACRKDGARERAADASAAPLPAESRAGGSAPPATPPATPSDTTVAERPAPPTSADPDAPAWPTEEPCRPGASKVWHAEARPMPVPPTAPAPVDGLPSALALAIDEGWNTCAVTPDRRAACWGVTIRGAVQDDPDVRGRPAPIEGLADVVAVFPSGTPHACALRMDGSVACFGAPNDRKLGSAANETGWGETPRSIEGLPPTAGLAVGFGFACALAVDDGAVRCWGRNESGQLGNRTLDSRSTPAPVPGLTGVTSIAAGREQTCALLADGTVRCWGDMLATRCAEQVPVPVEVPGLADAVQISVGWDHACATLADGTVRCWGDGEGGQIGDGALERRFLPAAVAGISEAAAVEAGDGVTCALRRDRAVLCWGKNQCGQVDGGASGRPYHATPVPVPGVADVVQLAVGGMQTCALRSDGVVLCWGATTPSQLMACLAAW